MANYEALARFLPDCISLVNQQCCRPGGSPNDASGDIRDDELAVTATGTWRGGGPEAPANPAPGWDCGTKDVTRVRAGFLFFFQSAVKIRS